MSTGIESLTIQALRFTSHRKKNERTPREWFFFYAALNAFAALSPEQTLEALQETERDMQANQESQ